jgi:hypothetical protein
MTDLLELELVLTYRHFDVIYGSKPIYICAFVPEPTFQNIPSLSLFKLPQFVTMSKKILFVFTSADKTLTGAETVSVFAACRAAVSPICICA